MKRKYRFIIILLILLDAVSCASPSHKVDKVDEEGVSWVLRGLRIHHVFNGKTWQTLDTQAKIMQLVGFEEGTSLLYLELLDMKVSDAVLDDINSATDRMTVSGVNFSDLVEHVDTFYSDTANLNVPVLEAYRYVLAKLKGESAEKLGNLTIELRIRYDK